MAATENSARTRATFAPMAGGLLALIVIVAAAIWLAGRTVALNDAAATARLERFHSSNILTALLDAETGQRGYLLLRWAKMVESATSSDMVEPMSPIVIRSMAAESDEGSFWCSSPP